MKRPKPVPSIFADPFRRLNSINKLGDNIIRDVIRQQSAVLRKKELNVRLALAQELRPCHGDHNQLERMLWNLIDNAIKFTPEGGAITLTSRMIANNISPSIKDTGIGIPKNELSLRPKIPLDGSCLVLVLGLPAAL